MEGKVVRIEIDQVVKEMPRLFAKLDKAIAPGHLAGPDFSAADCFLLPMLAAVQMFPEGKEGFEASDKLMAYFNKVAARPSFEATAQ